MPIYEFACRKCNTDFEKLVSASQRDSVACPSCGNDKTMRKVSLAAPAQMSSGRKAAEPAGCGMPSCCGGGCGLPN